MWLPMGCLLRRPTAQRSQPASQMPSAPLQNPEPRTGLAAPDRRWNVAPASSGDGHGIRFGLALHLGEVLYGNIGSGNRLDFTYSIRIHAGASECAGRASKKYWRGIYRGSNGCDENEDACQSLLLINNLIMTRFYETDLGTDPDSPFCTGCGGKTCSPKLLAGH